LTLAEKRAALTKGAMMLRATNAKAQNTTMRVMMRRERDGACFELVSGMAIISRRANVTAPVDLDYNVEEGCLWCERWRFWLYAFLG
jgi:hypothetical protein